VEESLAKDHYLLLVEKEVWTKGKKTSKPVLKYYAVNDFQEALNDAYFEKHSLSVEILHDPTKSEDDESDDSDEGSGSTLTKTVKKKEDYIKEYADLMEVTVEDVDPKMTVKELQTEIAAIKKEKGIA
jgi:hypothetical protein